MGEKDKKTREKIITIFEIFYIKLHCKILYVRDGVVKMHALCGFKC